MGYTPEELQTLEDMNKVSQGLTPDATIPTNQAFIAENTETAKTPSLNTPVTNIASQAVPQTGVPAALNTSALNQTVQQGTQAQQLTGLSQYANKDYVAPEYTNQDFFPGMGQPIVVGNVSSKTLGSSALIAPTGQYVPYNIIAKRERALDEARKAREERKAKYKDPTAPSMESPKYNKNLQDAYYQELEAAKAKAKAKYGEYWIDAAQDQGNETYTEFQKINNTYNWLAKEGDELTKNAAAVIEAVEKGDDTSYSKGEVEAAYAIQNGSFGGAKPEELVAQGKILKGYRNIETNLKESQFFKDVLPTITAKVIDGNGYVTQQESKNWSEQIQKEAEYLKKTKYNYLDEVTVDMIKEAMEARLPKYQIKKDITMKPQTPSYVNKAKTQEDLVTDRFNYLYKVQNNPVDAESGDFIPEVKRLTDTLPGIKLGDKTITEATPINPKIYKNVENITPKIIEIANKAINEDKTNKFFDINNEEYTAQLQSLIDSYNSTVENEYERVNAQVRIQDEEKPNLVTIYSGGNKLLGQVDMSNENAAQEIDKILINSMKYGSYEDKSKPRFALTVKDSDGIETQVVKGFDDETLVVAINSGLNKEPGEDLKVDQQALDKKAKEAGGWVKNPAKTITKVDTSYVSKLSPADKKKYDKAKASGYTELELKEYFSK